MKNVENTSFITFHRPSSPFITLHHFSSPFITPYIYYYHYIHMNTGFQLDTVTWKPNHTSKNLFCARFHQQASLKQVI